MSEAIIENLSGKKLGALIVVLIFCQAVCFLIGGLVAPSPATATMAFAANCLDTNHSTKWFYVRGEGACDSVDLREVKDMKNYVHLVNEIVFVFQLPLSKDDKNLDFSRWQQNLIGVLELGIAYDKDFIMERNTKITLDAKLGYRNIGDSDMDWKLHSSSTENRMLHCDIKNDKEGYHYDCSVVPLFELGSLHHDYYLLNIRIPVNKQKHINTGLGRLEDVWLIAVNQNGGFTKIWVSMKTIFFPFIIGIMIWFWKRVHLLQRAPALVEKMLIFLGCSLTFLNTPFEYLTLGFDMPYMLLLDDLKQGIFYVALLSFWLVFVGEHLMITESENRNYKSYRKHICAVSFLCICLFLFDICERGIQLKNPFYSTWSTDLGFNLAITVIISAGFSTLFYFTFLTRLIWRVFKNISAKKAALSSMSAARRLHYQGVIYRFNFLMLATLLCAAMTAISYFLDQIMEDQWKWDDSGSVKYTSAFFTGVFGMWNIYIFSLIILYAPSHKQWQTDMDSHSLRNEEAEYSRLSTDPSQMSSITAFARKGALD